LAELNRDCNPSGGGLCRPRKNLSGGLSWFLPERRRHQCRRGQKGVV